MGDSLIGSDIQDGIIRGIADPTQGVLRPTARIRVNRTAAVIPAPMKLGGIHLPTLWASSPRFHRDIARLTGGSRGRKRLAGRVAALI